MTGILEYPQFPKGARGRVGDTKVSPRWKSDTSTWRESGRGYRGIPAVLLFPEVARVCLALEALSSIYLGKAENPQPAAHTLRREMVHRGLVL
jgi:hypothetical protein